MLVSQMKKNLSSAPAKQTEGPPVGEEDGRPSAYGIFKAVFEQSPQAIALTRAADDVIVAVNQEWVNLTEPSAFIPRIVLSLMA